MVQAAETMERPVTSSSTDRPKEPKLYAYTDEVVCIKIKMSTK